MVSIMKDNILQAFSNDYINIALKLVSKRSKSTDRIQGDVLYMLVHLYSQPQCTYVVLQATSQCVGNQSGAVTAYNFVSCSDDFLRRSAATVYLLKLHQNHFIKQFSVH